MYKGSLTLPAFIPPVACGFEEQQPGMGASTLSFLGSFSLARGRFPFLAPIALDFAVETPGTRKKSLKPQKASDPMSLRPAAVKNPI